MNPTGADGHILRCKSCGSYWHLVANCPDSWKNMAKVNIVKDENIVLFTGFQKEEVCHLMIDARNCAVLDNACSSTVCGENWINSYIASLDKHDKRKIQKSETQKVF